MVPDGTYLVLPDLQIPYHDRKRRRQGARVRQHHTAPDRDLCVGMRPTPPRCPAGRGALPAKLRRDVRGRARGNAQRHPPIRGDRPHAHRPQQPHETRIDRHTSPAMRPPSRACRSCETRPGEWDSTGTRSVAHRRRPRRHLACRHVGVCARVGPRPRRRGQPQPRTRVDGDGRRPQDRRHPSCAATPTAPACSTRRQVSAAGSTRTIYGLEVGNLMGRDVSYLKTGVGGPAPSLRAPHHRPPARLPTAHPHRPARALRPRGDGLGRRSAVGTTARRVPVMRAAPTASANNKQRRTAMSGEHDHPETRPPPT